MRMNSNSRTAAFNQTEHSNVKINRCSNDSSSNGFPLDLLSQEIEDVINNPWYGLSVTDGYSHNKLIRCHVNNVAESVANQQNNPCKYRTTEYLSKVLWTSGNHHLKGFPSNNVAVMNDDGIKERLSFPSSMDVTTSKLNQSGAFNDCRHVDIDLFIWLCLQICVISNHCLYALGGITSSAVGIVRRSLWPILLNYFNYNRCNQSIHWTTLLLQGIQVGLIAIVYASLYILSMGFNVLLYPVPNWMSNRFSLFNFSHTPNSK